MDLLIKNIELPKAGELWLWLAVNSDGTVSVYEHDKNVRKTTASKWQDDRENTNAIERIKTLGRDTSNFSEEYKRAIRDCLYVLKEVDHK